MTQFHINTTYIMNFQKILPITILYYHYITGYFAILLTACTIVKLVHTASLY